MPDKYHFQAGQDFKASGHVFISGPQSHDGVPEGVRSLLNDDSLSVDRVILVHADDERKPFQIYNKLQD